MWLAHGILATLRISKNALHRLFGSRRNAQPLGKGYKFRQGSELHVIHHPAAMGLDGALGTTACAGLAKEIPRDNSRDSSVPCGLDR